MSTISVAEYLDKFAPLAVSDYSYLSDMTDQIDVLVYMASCCLNKSDKRLCLVRAQQLINNYHEHVQREVYVIVDRRTYDPLVSVATNGLFGFMAVDPNKFHF